MLNYKQFTTPTDEITKVDAALKSGENVIGFRVNTDSNYLLTLTYGITLAGRVDLLAGMPGTLKFGPAAGKRWIITSITQRMVGIGGLELDGYGGSATKLPTGILIEHERNAVATPVFDIKQCFDWLDMSDNQWVEPVNKATDDRVLLTYHDTAIDLNGNTGDSLNIVSADVLTGFSLGSNVVSYRGYEFTQGAQIVP